MNVVHQAFVTLGARRRRVASPPAARAARTSRRGPSRNQRVIDEHKITGRTRELPGVTVPMVLADGEPVERAKLPDRHDRARRRRRRSAGAAARCSSALEMQPGAAYPAQTLNEELIRHRPGRLRDDRVRRQDGGADEGPRALPAARRHAIDEGWRERLEGVRGLLAGAARSSRAGGPEHVRRRTSSFPDQGVTPSLQPGVVVNLNEIQWTPLTDPVARASRTAAARRCRGSSGGRTRRSA